MNSTQFIGSPRTPDVGKSSTPAPVDWQKRHTELVRACETVLEQWDRSSRHPIGRDLRKALDKYG